MKVIISVACVSVGLLVFLNDESFVGVIIDAGELEYFDSTSHAKENLRDIEYLDAEMGIKAFSESIDAFHDELKKIEKDLYLEGLEAEGIIEKLSSMKNDDGEA